MCLNNIDASRFYLENRFKRTRITSVGSAPKLDTEAWAEDVRTSPAVIDRELKEISTLFTEEFIGDILEDEDSLWTWWTGRLDPALMKKFFNYWLANYCLLMLGEECPPVRGCGFNGLCRPEESCRNDNSFLGFKCVHGRRSKTPSCSAPLRGQPSGWGGAWESS